MLVYSVSKLRLGTVCSPPSVFALPLSGHPPQCLYPLLAISGVSSQILNAIKCNFGVLNELIKTRYFVFSHLSVCPSPDC